MDTESAEISDIEEFWKDPFTEEQLSPQIAITNNKGSAILAVGRDGESKQKLLFLDLTKQPRKKVIFPITKLLGIDTIYCAEISCSQRVLYLGCSSESWASFTILNFSSSLDQVYTERISLGNYKCVTTIKRIPGTDILLLGTYKALIVYWHKHTTKVQMLSLLEVCVSQITDIAFFSNFCLLLDEKPGSVVRVKFQGKLDMDECLRVEKMWVEDKTKNQAEIKT